MALRYEWSWDISQLAGPLAIKVTDLGGTSEFAYSSGTYAHTSISSVVSGYSDFATQLQTDLNDDATLSGTYTVTWNGTTGYTITATAGTNVLQLAFSSFSGGSADADGTRMKQILGMSGDRTGALTYSSQVRPYYVIIPAIQGRSQMSDEYEPDGIMFEAIADDGSPHQISKYADPDDDDAGEIWLDWTQQAETELGPSSAFGEGTFVHRRHGTSTAPWTYQHAWTHQRLGYHPFLVVDGSEQAVCLTRADGASFHPTRFAGEDQPLWSVPFRVRLLGRL